MNSPCLLRGLVPRSMAEVYEAPCSVNQQPEATGNGAKQPVHVNISVSAQSQPVEVIRYSTDGECQCLLGACCIQHVLPLSH